MKRQARAFTLLEMLAAMAVFAVCCSVLLVAFGRSAQVLTQVRHSDRLSLAARSVLDEQSAAPLAAGEHDGLLDNTIHWRMRVSQASTTPTQLPLFRIDLQLVEQGRHLDVSTLIVQNPPTSEATP